MLPDHDRRKLAEIERNLRRDDPGLEQVLTPTPVPQPPWVPHAWTATAGVLIFLAGMLGLGQLAALCGLVLVAIAALEWTAQPQPTPLGVRGERHDRA